MEKGDFKKVLYLSYDGLTDPLGQSQILPYLQGLSALGHKISIASFEKCERFATEESNIRKICEGSNIKWLPFRYHKNPPVLSTIFDLLQLRRKAISWTREFKFDIVHCRSYLTPLIGFILKKKFGVKLIFDMRGFWADERVDGGLWSIDSLFYRRVFRFFKKKEREFIINADHVVVLTHAAKALIDSWDLKTKVSVIPCCVDLSLFNPDNISAQARQSLRDKLNFKADDFVLVYVGSIGTWYLYDEMIDYFKKIRKSIPNAKFLFLTPDHTKVPPDDDIIALSVGREEVPLYISISNASICFIKPSFSKKGSSATKMAEVLAMEIPVLTNSGWGDVEFFQPKIPGLIVVNKNEAFAPSCLNVESARNEYFVRMFSLAEGITKYDELYRSS
jgi:glycosyltransferase involved in cell wall biosynthesis